MKQGVGLLLSLVVIALASAGAEAKLGAGAPDWRAPALRLNAESNSEQDQAREELRKLPDLDRRLRAALQGPDRSLALRVIRDLRERALLGDLLGILPQDGQGSIHRTVSVIARPEDEARVAAAFREELAKLPKNQKAASTVQILAFLGKHGIRLDQGELDRLVEDDSYEVRESVQSYIAARPDPATYVAELGKALTLSPYTARLSALETLGRIPDKAAVLEQTKGCPKDQDERVRAACTRLREKLGAR
jgi:hypothetical protein